MIQKKLEDEIETQNNLPTQKQIYNLKHYAKIKSMPSKDAFSNLLSFSPFFVREFSLIPATRILCITDFGLELLKTCQAFLVDGTFDICEMDLTLTTVMAVLPDYAIPVAFFIHSSKVEEEYTWFFNELKKLSGLKMNPIKVSSDFENALRNATRSCFPNATYCGDLFHFLQANIKRMKNLGGNEFVKELVSDLKILQDSPTAVEFQAHQAIFIKNWTYKFAPYAHYFTETWTKLHPPACWARFIVGTPLGTNPLEGWHNRLKSVMPQSNQAIDFVVKALLEETKHWEITYSTPHLHSSKVKATLEGRKQFQKRKTLKLVTENSKSSMITTISTANEELTLPPAEENLIIASPENLQPTDPENQSPLSPKNSSIIRSTENEEDQHNDDQKEPALKKSKFTCKNCNGSGNKDCTFKLCQSCCKAYPGVCRVTAHAVLKVTMFAAPIVNQIEKAMHEGSTLWIRYNSGRNVGKIRPILPQKWIRQSVFFTAIDPNHDNKEKKFYSLRIAEATFSPPL